MSDHGFRDSEFSRHLLGAVSAAGSRGVARVHFLREGEAQRGGSEADGERRQARTTTKNKRREGKGI